MGVVLVPVIDPAPVGRVIRPDVCLGGGLIGDVVERVVMDTTISRPEIETYLYSKLCYEVPLWFSTGTIWGIAKIHL